MEIEQLDEIIEALLLVSGEGISMSEIVELLDKIAMAKDQQ